MSNLKVKLTYKLNSFKNNFTGEENHVISCIEKRESKKFVSIEFETNDLNRAKSKLRLLNALNN